MIRSKIPDVQISPCLSHRPLAGVADGYGVQLHPALSISVVSKSVSKIPSLVALLAGTAPAYSSIPGRLT